MKKYILSFITLFSSLYSANHNHILKKVSNYIPDNPIIIEAGAHKGEDTERMAQFWPNGTIYAFEPSPDSFAELEQKTDLLSNVRRYPYALSDYEGLTHFYISTDNSGASSTLPPAEWFTLYHFNKEPISVPCTSLDAWATKHMVDHVDFMWLDMEGNELKALQAAPLIFQTVKVLYIELNNKEFRIGTPHYSTVKGWLESQGFRSINETRAYHKGDWWQSDVLFVRNR